MSNEDFTRWHDKSNKTTAILNILEEMPEKNRDELAVYLYQVVKLVWRENKSENDELSIGRDKLFSYYKAYNRRRWYDKNPSLASAINLMSTLPGKELDMIAENFITAIKQAGNRDLYEKVQKKLDELEKNNEENQ